MGAVTIKKLYIDRRWMFQVIEGWQWEIDKRERHHTMALPEDAQV
jgi:hypothetical protein